MSQRIHLDATPGLFHQVLHCHQGDVGRQFEIAVVTRDGYEIPSGATFKIQATKPSGLGFTVTGTAANNIISFTSTEDMTSEAGEIPTQLEIKSGNDVIYTSNFLLVCEKNTHPSSVTDGSPEEIISEITLLVERAETAASTAGADAAAAAQARVDEMMDYLPSEVADLKSDLSLFEDGFHDLNLFRYAILLGEGKYVSISDGHIVLSNNANMNAYLLPVDGESIYTFTEIRFGLLLDSDKYTAVGTLKEDKKQMDSTGGSYIAFSFNKNNYPIATFEVSKGIVLQSGLVLPDWLDDLGSKVYDLEYQSGVNLFPYAKLYAEGKYVNISDGHLSLSTNANLDTYIIPVDGKSIYTFTNTRFALLLEADQYTAVGGLLDSVTQIDSTGGSYIAFCFNKSNYSLATYEVVGKKDNSTKPNFVATTGNIASGGELHLTNAKTNLRKGERIAFSGNITSFSSLKIGLTNSLTISADTYHRNFCVIDGTNISYYETPTSTPVVIAHGLTITNNIQIIWEMLATASLKLTLISNGVLFEHEFSNFVRKLNSLPFVLSISTVLTDCKLSWTCLDLNKKIWMFGDSYIQYSPARWSYYLHEYGYDKNCLLDGYPGQGSVNAKNAFNTLTAFDAPKYAVWCMGMNDGSDSESAPESSWVTRRDEFLQACSLNDVTPIFATIPTVPSVNNEKKNEWIRSSGYRYIDFAKAVGANSSGVWYSGMLSTDNVHPTEQGARALFARVLLDLPEIMVSDFGY